MSGVLVSEMRKIYTVRLWWIMLICVFLVGGAYALVPAFSAGLAQSTVGDPTPAFQVPGTLRSIYNGGNTLARILALVIGILAMGGEYRYKTMATTYLATPVRMRVVRAKALSLLAVGLLYGLASVLAGVLVAIPFVLIEDGSMFLDRGDTWRSLILGIVSIALWTLIGMGLGVLIRNMVLAMLVGIGFAYVVEPALTALFFLKHWDVGLNLMPTGATNAMLGVTSPLLFAAQDPFGWWAGMLVLAAWCLLPAIAGVLITVRRDVA
jgi:ABC-2 type transport system permease protein